MILYFLSRRHDFDVFGHQRLYRNNNFCRKYIKYLHTRQSVQLPSCICLLKESFLLTSDWPQLPLSCWMKDSFIENNTWAGPLVCRFQTRRGRRIWFNGRQKKEKGLSVCLFPCFIQYHITGSRLRKQMHRFIFISEESKAKLGNNI